MFSIFLFLLSGVLNFLPTEKEFAGNCPGVISFLKREAFTKLRASRSSDGPGEASYILNHKKGAISGTTERENSWWSIDLGLSHRLIITHYSLRQGKRHGESVLADWQLEGSQVGNNWEELKVFTTGRIHSSSLLLHFIQVPGLSEGKYRLFAFFEFSRRVEIPLVDMEYIYLELSCTEYF